MTIDQYIDKQKRKLNDIKRFYKPFEASVRNVVALQSVRIFTDGIKTDGSPIGHYDTTHPFYVNPNTSAGAVSKSKKLNRQGLKPTTGKTGEHVFQNGKVHKTTYVNNYKDYRNRIGKRTDRVNLVLSGDLQLDFNNSQTSARVIPKKISDVEYQVTLKREGNIDKMEGNEARFGRIFGLTKSEKDAFYKTLNFNFKKVSIDG